MFAANKMSVVVNILASVKTHPNMNPCNNITLIPLAMNKLIINKLATHISIQGCTGSV